MYACSAPISRKHGATYIHSCPSPVSAAIAASTPDVSQPAAVTIRKRCKRRATDDGSDSGAANNGRLMIERATRDAKKTTNAAAVHGSPPRHPETSTTTAPIANSVSQNARNPAFAYCFGAAD